MYSHVEDTRAVGRREKGYEVKNALRITVNQTIPFLAAILCAVEISKDHWSAGIYFGMLVMSLFRNNLENLDTTPPQERREKNE